MARLKEELQLRQLSQSAPTSQAAMEHGGEDQNPVASEEQDPAHPSKDPLGASPELMHTPEQRMMAQNLASTSRDVSAGPVSLEAPVTPVNSGIPTLGASASSRSLPAGLPTSCQLQAQRGTDRLQSLGDILSTIDDTQITGATRIDSEKVSPSHARLSSHQVLILTGCCSAFHRSKHVRCPSSCWPSSSGCGCRQ